MVLSQAIMVVVMVQGMAIITELSLDRGSHLVLAVVTSAAMIMEELLESCLDIGLDLVTEVAMDVKKVIINNN
jgi:hypothetical protein